MENLTYTTQQIEQILQIINNIPVSGIENCNKIITIYQILNNNIKDNVNNLDNK